MSTKNKASSSRDNLKQTTMGDYLSRSKEDKKPRMKKKRSILVEDDADNRFFGRFRSNDLETYREGYPGKKDDKNALDNWKFYSNKIKSYPNGDLIDNIHKDWWGDYHLLERHHGYIQWIFPIRETGMNFHSQELQLHEIEKIKNDEEALERVFKSYLMMLDFYGMKLENRDTGIICRAKNWKERFNHLNRSYHNYLRITRILKSLGEFGFEHLKRPFVEFVLQEAMEENTLNNCLESCVRYWLETIRSDKDRDSIKNYIRKMEEGYGTENPPNQESRGNYEFDMDDDKPLDDMKNKSEQNLAAFDSQKQSSPTNFDEDSHEANMEDEDLAAQEEELVKKFKADNELLQNRDTDKSDCRNDEDDMEMDSKDKEKTQNLGLV